MELSMRLQAVADLVPQGTVVADVGTDHAYIPIYLVEAGICPKAYAMDINRGPLARAKEHIAEHELEDRIEAVLSDGLENLPAGAAQTMIASGIGGQLTCMILDAGKDCVDHLETIILQPHAEMEKVRRHLGEIGLRIEEEVMVEEDGKYYPMLRAVHGTPEAYRPCEYRYGPLLLKKKDPVLYRYLQRSLENTETILSQITLLRGSEHIDQRIGELQKEREQIREALKYYE